PAELLLQLISLAAEVAELLLLPLLQRLAGQRDEVARVAGQPEEVPEQGPRLLGPPQQEHQRQQPRPRPDRRRVRLDGGPERPLGLGPVVPAHRQLSEQELRPGIGRIPVLDATERLARLLLLPQE